MFFTAPSPNYLLFKIIKYMIGKQKKLICIFFCEAEFSCLRVTWIPFHVPLFCSFSYWDLILVLLLLIYMTSSEYQFFAMFVVQFTDTLSVFQFCFWFMIFRSKKQCCVKAVNFSFHCFFAQKVLSIADIKKHVILFTAFPNTLFVTLTLKFIKNNFWYIRRR